jgi:hypothetical protein
MEEELLNQIDAIAGIVAGSRAAFIREACQQRLKSLRAVEKKVLDYYVADLDIRLKKENIASLFETNRYFRRAAEIFRRHVLDPGYRISVKNRDTFFGGFHGR